MDTDEARARFAEAAVARLGTVGADVTPHLVPITFALLGSDEIVFAVDHKPKRTRALRRLANIQTNPAVAVLVDHYEDDWSALWWARADGDAVVYPPSARPEALDALASRYDQYRDRPPQGPVVVIGVRRWSGWSAAVRRT